MKSKSLTKTSDSSTETRSCHKAWLSKRLGLLKTPKFSFNWLNKRLSSNHFFSKALLDKNKEISWSKMSSSIMIRAKMTKLYYLLWISMKILPSVNLKRTSRSQKFATSPTQLSRRMVTRLLQSTQVSYIWPKTSCKWWKTFQFQTSTGRSNSWAP